jgi:hypothetical protein
MPNPRPRIVVGRLQGARHRAVPPPRIVLGHSQAQARFHDALTPANAGTHTFTPSDPLEYVPPVAQRHGNEAVTYRRGDGPYIAGADEGVQYRYVYDDETGLVVRFQHELSPEVEEQLAKVKDEVQKPARIATLGAIFGFLIGAAVIGAFVTKALGGWDDEG